jgi:hypothetical protein
VPTPRPGAQSRPSALTAGPGTPGGAGADPTSRGRTRWAPADGYEYQPLRIAADMSRSAAAGMLALRAEFTGWELARVLRYPDGSRQVWLRRKPSPGLLPDVTP